MPRFVNESPINKNVEKVVEKIKNSDELLIKNGIINDKIKSIKNIYSDILVEMNEKVNGTAKVKGLMDITNDELMHNKWVKNTEAGKSMMMFIKTVSTFTQWLEKYTDELEQLIFEEGLVYLNESAVDIIKDLRLDIVSLNEQISIKNKEIQDLNARLNYELSDIEKLKLKNIFIPAYKKVVIAYYIEGVEAARAKKVELYRNIVGTKDPMFPGGYNAKKNYWGNELRLLANQLELDFLSVKQNRRPFGLWGTIPPELSLKNAEKLSTTPDVPLNQISDTVDEVAQ